MPEIEVGVDPQREAAPSAKADGVLHAHQEVVVALAPVEELELGRKPEHKALAGAEVAARDVPAVGGEAPEGVALDVLGGAARGSEGQ